MIIAGGDVITHADAADAATAGIIGPLRLGSAVTTFNIADGAADVDFRSAA